jgi:tetratricopeptide (TPR) repeat protein
LNLPFASKAGLLLGIAGLGFALFCSSNLTFAQAASKKCKAPEDLERRISVHPSADAYDALGGYFGTRNEFSCAITAFRSALRLRPNSWQTRYFLGQTLLQNGDAAHAVEQLRISLRLSPDQFNTHLGLGAALSRLDQMDAAEAEFIAALRLYPESEVALDWLAKAFITQERYTAAIALLKNATPDEVLQMDLVIADSKAGNNEEAIQILSRLAQEQPDSASPHSTLATIYTQQNRLEEAAAEFKKAREINPQDDNVNLSYAKVLILLANYDGALPIIKDYLQRHPEAFDGYYLSGVVDRDLGNYSAAKVALEHAIRLDPNHYDARYNLGVALAKSGEPAAARPQLEKAVQLDPSAPEAHFQLASVLRALSLAKEGQQELDLYRQSTAQKTKKDIAATKANQGNALLAKGENQKAVELYKEAVEQDPKNAHMFYNLALALDRQGDYQAEQQALQQGLALDPHFAAAHNQLGYLSLQAGQTDQAEQEFKAAIALDEHFAEAQNNLGTLYGQQGNDRKAEALFRGAIQSNPEYGQAFMNLGVTLASEGRFSEAQSALHSALRIEPDNKDIMSLLAKVQDELTRKKQP